MDQLLENPQAIFLLVFMAIAFLKFIGKKLKGENNEENSEQAQEPLEYESVRQQILEEQRSVDAAPVPSAEQPSRNAPDQLSILDFIVPSDTRKPTNSSPPPLPASQPATPRKTDTGPSAVRQAAAKPSLTPAEARALENLRKRRVDPPIAKRSPSRRSIRQQLAGPAAARDAIILGEILGPPRGQHSFSKLGPLDNG